MAVQLPKSIYVHLMKTGGWSVRDALSAMKLNMGEVGRDHDPACLLPLQSGKRPFTFVFIRHPLTWYRSYWAYRMQGNWAVFNGRSITGWQTYGSILDHECRSADFAIWMENILNHIPEGFLSRIYRIYTDNVDYVGKVESLCDDLCRALRLADEEFSSEAIQTFPKRNVTNSKFTSFAKLPKDLAEKVMEAEALVINKWNYNWIPDDILALKTDCKLEDTQNERLWNPESASICHRTENETKATEFLTTGVFFYHRVGYDCRLLSFNANGTIGKGSAGCELFWNIREENHVIYLDIFSKAGLTCTLQLDDSGAYHGRWAKFERMDVKLIKAG